jgi:Di-haem oxidoreductase, putative peroxidase
MKRGALLLFFIVLLHGEEPRWQPIAHGDENTPETAAWIIRHDPARAAEVGRRALTRTWSASEGASPPQAARVLSQQKPPQLGFFPSCTLCHQQYFGAGPVVSFGTTETLRTPHLWGAGIKDSLAHTIAEQLITHHDKNNDHYLERHELTGRLLVNTGVDQTLDFGAGDDRNADGFPDSDPVIAWQFYDDTKRVVVGGHWQQVSVHYARPFIQAFGSHPRTGGMTTLRGAIIGAFALHAGLQTYDPTFGAAFYANQPRGIMGIIQPHFGALPDLGVMHRNDHRAGDDADRDGIRQELTAGDIDIAEYFLSTLPPPHFSARDDDAGMKLFQTFGCASCHTPHWNIGDVSTRGIFSDFRSHQLSDNPTQPRLRTPALWGSASQLLFGHDGAAPTFDAIILQHAGEATHSRQQYENASPDQQRVLRAFLADLRLQPEPIR